MERRFLNGQTVKALRDSLGIPHGVLARDVLISAGYLTNIEKGARQPTPQVIRRIADRLGVSIDAITYPGGGDSGSPFRNNAEHLSPSSSDGEPDAAPVNAVRQPTAASSSAMNERRPA